MLHPASVEGLVNIWECLGFLAWSLIHDSSLPKLLIPMALKGVRSGQFLRQFKKCWQDWRVYGIIPTLNPTSCHILPMLEDGKAEGDVKIPF